MKACYGILIQSSEEAGFMHLGGLSLLRCDIDIKAVCKHKPSIDALSCMRYHFWISRITLASLQVLFKFTLTTIVFVNF
jgi:hypothetical protein